MELIEEFKRIANFDISYSYQFNQGKHFAWNKALDYANGYMFVPADSDDSFEPNTLEFFYEKWQLIEDKESFSGINVLCKDPFNMGVVGDLYPKDGFISNMLELTYKYKIKGEKWGCIRVDILKDNKLPEILGRGSYILSKIWFEISYKYNVVCYNIPLRNYFLEQDNITTKRGNFQITVPILLHYSEWHFSRNFKEILKYGNLFDASKAVIDVWRYNLFQKNGLFNVLKKFSMGNKIVLVIYLIPSLMVYYLTLYKLENEK